MIRSKFLCVAVEKVVSWRKEDPFLYTAKFNPVGKDGAPENAVFWSATPSGQITLTSILPDAFEVGQEYYVDFSAVVAV